MKRVSYPSIAEATLLAVAGNTSLQMCRMYFDRPLILHQGKVRVEMISLQLSLYQAMEVQMRQITPGVLEFALGDFSTAVPDGDMLYLYLPEQAALVSADGGRVRPGLASGGATGQWS